MINYEKLKGIFKNKVRVTDAFLVFFLITGSMGYGMDTYQDYTNEGTIIEEGNGINLQVGGLNITNNGIISGYISSEDYSGNGIFSYQSAMYIVNNGVIYGTISDSGSEGYSGNGISILESIEYITNNGVIYGSATKGDYSGNGIDSPEGIRNIINNGIISASSSNGNYSGNGVSSSQSIENVTNSGMIAASASFKIGTVLGNGITGYQGVGNITNSGIISGFASLAPQSQGSGNGIFSNVHRGPIETINNTGVISGYFTGSSFFNDSGNGIHSKNITNIINSGVIKGNKNSIYSPNITNGKNYGILAGNKNPDNIDNKGIFIVLDSSGNIENYSVGLGGEITIDGVKKYIINTSGFFAYKNSSDLNKDQINNVIINGLGTNNTGSLTVDESISLNNSIINGYETALYVQSDKSFTGNNIIFNGGGLKNDIAVIKGDDGTNTLEILGNSIINGAVDLGAGDDALTLANSVQINEELDGNLGVDTLNLGQNTVAKTTSNLNILHNISGFENINTNGNVTLFETISVTGAEQITLESGNLTLRVDPTKTMDGKVIGHALYGNEGILSSTGGNLVIGLNGLGVDTIISTGGTKIDTNINDSWWKPNDYLTTNSLVLDAKLQGDDILITIKESIPLEPPVPPVDPDIPEPPVPPIQTIDPGLYEELNKVYKSIINAGQIGELANTTLLEDKTFEEALGGLLTILDQIYANNLYAYTLKSSRDSLKLFEDNLSYLTIKPKEKEWIVQGKGFYSGVKNDSSDSGKGFYGFDTAQRNYKTTTSFGGGLATAEYGLTNDSSVGFVLGGGHQSTDFKGSSKIKGNSLYLGAFAKKEITQFKFMSGIGYQYGSLKGERVVTNKYNYFKTDDRYDVNSFNVFVETKYDYALNNDWTLSPKAKLSWYYVSQDSVNEGYEPGNLSLKVDSATGNTGDLEIGFDLKNNLALNSGKLSNILSLGLINTIGDREKDLTGNILGAQKNGNSFDIRGIELPRTSGKLSYNLEYEKTNGMIYTLGVGYEFAEDNNKNVTGTVGLGYKF